MWSLYEYWGTYTFYHNSFVVSMAIIIIITIVTIIFIFIAIIIK